MVWGEGDEGGNEAVGALVVDFKAGEVTDGRFWRIKKKKLWCIFRILIIFVFIFLPRTGNNLKWKLIFSRIAEVMMAPLTRLVKRYKCLSSLITGRAFQVVKNSCSFL